MSDEVQGSPTSGTGVPGGEWRDVANALDALGASITNALQCATENEEYRKRLRELRDGLAYLTVRIGEGVGTAPAPAPAPSPAPRFEQPMQHPYSYAPVHSLAQAPAQAAPPATMDAFRSASEKFRQASERWDQPGAAPVAGQPYDTSSWAPVVAGGAAVAAAGAALGASATGAMAAPVAAQMPVPAPLAPASGQSDGSVWCATPTRSGSDAVPSSVWCAAPASTVASAAPSPLSAPVPQVALESTAAFVSPFAPASQAPAPPLGGADVAGAPAVLQPTVEPGPAPGPDDLLAVVRAASERFQREREAAEVAAREAAPVLPAPAPEAATAPAPEAAAPAPEAAPASDDSPEPPQASESAPDAGAEPPAVQEGVASEEPVPAVDKVGEDETETDQEK